MDEQQRDIDKLRWELDAMKKSVEELEKVVEKLKDDRAKLGGMAILLVSLGSILLWFSSIGGNVAKVLGK